MGLPHFEVATGTIDGSNKTFFVSLPYLAGYTAVFLNGQLKRADFGDGWFETDPSAGQIDLVQAPLVGDVVQVFFLDAAAGGICEEVSPLHGTLVEVDVITGCVREVDPICGYITDPVCP